MKPTQDELDRIERHDHTSPTADGCPLCEAFEGIERYAPKTDGLTAAQRRVREMRKVTTTGERR